MITIAITLPFPPKREYNFNTGVDVVTFDNFHVGTIIKVTDKIDKVYNKKTVTLEIDYIQKLTRNYINLDEMLNIWKNGEIEINHKDDDFKLEDK